MRKKPRTSADHQDELQATKIRLFARDIETAKDQASVLGLPWQTHVRSLVHKALRGGKKIIR